MSKRRVVVTGLGLIGPLGCSVETTWQSIINGKSGIRMMDDLDTSDYTTKFAGTVQDFNVEKYMPAKEARRNDLFIQYGLAAGIESVEDSGLMHTPNINLDRVGVIIGSGIGGLSTIESTTYVLLNQGPRRVTPFYIPGSVINMVSGNISIRYGFKGPNLAVATSCTTGCHAVGLAARTIAYGDADVMVAGGSEKASVPLSIAGFAVMRALSTRNDAPEKASRPWDKDRDGLVMGDGAASLVLEEYEHAKKRGAKIYAEIAGFGMSADAFHITRPPEGAPGGAAAMKLAMKDAGMNIEDVDYINAHGTSTLAGDVDESLAIESVFGEHATKKKLLVSSTKSMTGHLLGATGAIEAIFCVLAIRDQIAPPTINLDNPDKNCNLDYVAHTARKAKIFGVLSNSFGFGGTNGTLAFKKI